MATPRQDQLIKFDVCLYKKDNISYDEFIKYATEVYPPKAVPLMKKHGIVQWAANEMGRPEWTVPDYDIVMSYWLRSVDDLRALTTDPEWDELEKEAQEITNMTIGHFVIGHQTIHLQGDVQNSTGA
ncbi:hypothetical protein SLS62_003503 [Diatrype stigma]|uniref:EthD domain-containing protein n=1 Tax=Diatrype stigma TaxID=117547 RepID=A0AAN9UUS4_9PEZI